MPGHYSGAPPSKPPGTASPEPAWARESSDGTDVRRLTENRVGDYAPRWSSDGAMIAFDSDSTGERHWEVYVIGADGTNLRRVTNTAAPATSINPAWRPDLR